MDILVYALTTTTNTLTPLYYRYTSESIHIQVKNQGSRLIGKLTLTQKTIFETT